MSQLNVDALRNSSGTGAGIDLQSSGNIAFDTNTLYVDSTNDRVGINNAAPAFSFDITGTEGINFNTSPLMDKVNIVSGSAENYTNIDLLTAGTWVFTSAVNGNWTPNFRGNSSTSLSSLMSVGQSAVFTIITPVDGGSGYSSNMNIDGSGQTEYWSNALTPSASGGTSGYDIYQYSVIRTSTSSTGYLVFASQTHLE